MSESRGDTIRAEKYPTPAIEFAELLALTRWRPGQAAVRLGVHANTVSCWLRQAQADIAGQLDPNGKSPAPEKVLHMRALVAASAVVPGLVVNIRWDLQSFLEALAEIPPVRLTGEVDPAAIRAAKVRRS